MRVLSCNALAAQVDAIASVAATPDEYSHDDLMVLTLTFGTAVDEIHREMDRRRNQWRAERGLPLCVPSFDYLPLSALGKMLGKDAEGGAA